MSNIEVEIAIRILREADQVHSSTQDRISHTINVATSVLASFAVSAVTVGATSVPDEQFIQQVADILVNKTRMMLERRDAKDSG